MPLIKKKSEKAFEHNVKAEMDAGKPQKQSLAIAYSVKRKPKKMAKGGMVDEDSMDKREMSMLDDAERMHKEELDLRKERMDGIDMSRDKMEMDMMDQEEDSLPGSIADEVYRRRKMAQGGEVDLQENGKENYNEEDQMSFDALRKKTYYDLDQMEDQPEDSNLHGGELSDEDAHDMIGAIRKKMRAKKGL